MWSYILYNIIGYTQYLNPNFVCELVIIRILNEELFDNTLKYRRPRRRLGSSAPADLTFVYVSVMKYVSIDVYDRNMCVLVDLVLGSRMTQTHAQYF